MNGTQYSNIARGPQIQGLLIRIPRNIAHVYQPEQKRPKKATALSKLVSIVEVKSPK